MKFPIWLARLLAYIQICIGFCLTGFTAVTNNLFFFIIGLGNIIMGRIIVETIKQGVSK